MKKIVTKMSTILVITITTLTELILLTFDVEGMANQISRLFSQYSLSHCEPAH